MANLVRRFRAWTIILESLRYKKSARSMRSEGNYCDIWISREACRRPHLSFDAAQTYDRRPANFTLSRLGYRRPWLGAAALRLLLAKAPVGILLQTTYSDQLKGNGSKSPLWITQYVTTTSLMQRSAHLLQKWNSKQPQWLYCIFLLGLCLPCLALCPSDVGCRFFWTVSARRFHHMNHA